MLGKVKSFLDLREKGSNGEPDKEGDEKSKPRTVEGTHVRTSETAELDFRSFVILIRVEFDVVLGVLLPLLLSISEEEIKQKLVDEIEVSDDKINSSDNGISQMCCMPKSRQNNEITYGHSGVNFSHFEILFLFDG